MSTVTVAKVAGDKGMSETKSKQQSPCSNCMHQTMTSCGQCMQYMHAYVYEVHALAGDVKG